MAVDAALDRVARERCGALLAASEYEIRPAVGEPRVLHVDFEGIKIRLKVPVTVGDGFGADVTELERVGGFVRPLPRLHDRSIGRWIDEDVLEPRRSGRLARRRIVQAETRTDEDPLAVGVQTYEV